MERGLPCSWTHTAPPSWSDVTPKPLLSTGLRLHTPPMSPTRDPLGVIGPSSVLGIFSGLFPNRSSLQPSLVLPFPSSPSVSGIKRLLQSRRTRPERFVLNIRQLENLYGFFFFYSCTDIRILQILLRSLQNINVCEMPCNACTAD